jgi:hypothetical protein
MPSQTALFYQTAYHDLFLQFLAEVMAATTSSGQALPRALQAYLEDLRPWVQPEDAPPNPRAVFPLFAEYALNEETDVITVRLSPEGEAFFRAWVRRHAILVEAGSQTDASQTH